MNILVTGANGQLGNEMRIVAAASHDSYFFADIVGEGLYNLDITDEKAINDFVAEYSIGLIINCAAYTNVDKAEDDREKAFTLNAEAPRLLALAMKKVGGWLVHISTDYVFGGNQCNTPCSESTTVNPTGVYGSTKLAGENAITASGANYLIIRTAWLYSEFGKNFVKTMLNLTSTHDRIKVVFDQTGTPTYAYDLAKAIFDIVEKRAYEGNAGVYHFSNEGVCSWFDFAKTIAEYSDAKCIVEPCHSSEFPSKVVRPAYSVLDKTKIKNTFSVQIPYWTTSLRKCLKNLKV